MSAAIKVLPLGLRNENHERKENKERSKFEIVAERKDRDTHRKASFSSIIFHIQGERKF